MDDGRGVGVARVGGRGIVGRDSVGDGRREVVTGPMKDTRVWWWGGG